MLCVRIPGGRTTALQLKTLAELAKTYGNGLLDLTTRQQFQLRHLTIEHVPIVFKKLEEVGLTSAQTGMDNVRNIMTCPLAGLNPEREYRCNGRRVGIQSRDPLESSVFEFAEEIQCGDCRMPRQLPAL